MKVSGKTLVISATGSNASCDKYDENKRIPVLTLFYWLDISF